MHHCTPSKGLTEESRSGTGSSLALSVGEVGTGTGGSTLSGLVKSKFGFSSGIEKQKI